jgi:hypothetical protein
MRRLGASVHACEICPSGTARACTSMAPSVTAAASSGSSAQPRVFTPMVLTDTGAKLSKSLIREGKVAPPPGAHPWMLDVTDWSGDTDSFVDAMVWLVGRMLADPKHFYRSCTTAEVDRIMTARRATTTGVRAREMMVAEISIEPGAAQPDDPVTNELTPSDKSKLATTRQIASSDYRHGLIKLINRSSRRC